LDYDGLAEQVFKEAKLVWTLFALSTGVQYTKNPKAKPQQQRGFHREELNSH